MDWSQERRKEAVIAELKSVYGDQFPQELEYADKIWVDDQYVSSRAFDYSPPKQYNGESLLRKTQWDNKLIFAGTETSSHYPGYMEGAYFSALEIVKDIVL